MLGENNTLTETPCMIDDYTLQLKSRLLLLIAAGLERSGAEMEPESEVKI